MAQQPTLAPRAGDTDQTITFSLEPQTDGYPVLVDDPFRTALAGAVAGGHPTQAYFDAVAATADFWALLAAGTITFAPGVDPQGRPVLMASSGNVELRVQAVYAGPPAGAPAGGGAPAGDEHPAFGVVTVTTRNTTTAVSSWLAVLARFATMPAYLPITADLFAKLLVPLYGNTRTLLGSLAGKLRAASSVESPDVDAEALVDDVLADQDGVIEDVAAELGEEGIEYMAVDWAAVGLDVAGLAPLMAIPMIIEFLGHRMTHSLVVQNMSGDDLTVELHQVHGDTTFRPAGDRLPGYVTVDDPLRPGHPLEYSYAANYQFANSTDLGDVGYVLTLRPTDGSPATSLVVGVPWSGDNGIWVGPAGDPAALYRRHAGGDGHTSVTAAVGRHRVTLSLNALRGETDGAYAYCSMAVVEPAAAGGGA